MAARETSSTYILALFLLISCCSAAPIGPPANGVAGVLSPSATNGITSGGSCGYGSLDQNSWPNGAIASLSSTFPLVAQLPLQGCGVCIQITCTDAQGYCTNNQEKVTVTIIDSGSAGQIYIPSSTFSQLASPAVGNVDVQLQQVDCTPPGNIQFRVSAFRPALGGYLKLAVFDAAGSASISNVEVKSSSAPDSTYLPLVRTFGAAYEGSNLPPLPLDVRITNNLNQQVVASGAITSSTTPGVVDTAVQFPPAGSASPGATPSPFIPATPVSEPTPAPTPAVSEPTPAPTPAPEVPTPAPVIASPPPTPAPAQPPNAPAAAPGPGNCQSIATILQGHPSLSTWYNALQTNGQASQLSNPSLRLTMFAPTNAAFDASTSAVSATRGLNAELANAGTISNLLAVRPSVRSPIIGYHVVPGSFPSSALSPGTSLATTDIVRVAGQPDKVLPLNITAPGKVQGVGSSATIIQPDIAACGGSYIHVIDNVLLPFDPAGPLP